MDPAGVQNSAVQQPQMEQELLRWTAMSRPYRPLDRQLFATGVVIAVLVSIIAAFAGEWMLIAVIAAMIFAYYVWSTVPPEMSEYLITTKGIHLHDQIHLWSSMTRWWADSKMGHTMIIIETPLRFPKELHLILGDTDENRAKEILGKYLPQEKPADTPMDKASRWLAEKFPLQAR